MLATAAVHDKGRKGAPGWLPAAPTMTEAGRPGRPDFKCGGERSAVVASPGSKERTAGSAPSGDPAREAQLGPPGDGPVRVVRMSGSWCADQAQLLDRALAEAGRDARPVVVDLHAVCLIDAAIVRTLRRFAAAAARHGTPFAVADASGQPLQVLDVLGVAKELRAHLTVADAVAELTAAPRGERGIDGTVHALVIEAQGWPDGHPERHRGYERAVEAALPLARTMALRYRQHGELLEDLLQVASIGVVRAVHDYDPDRGSGFLAYAVPTILGELRRHLRDHAWSVRAPRRLQELRSEIVQTSPWLAQSLGRSPTRDEIAGHIGADVAQVEQAMQTVSGMRPVSLDAPAVESGCSLYDLIGASDPALDRMDYRLSLRAMIAALPPEAQELLRLRFDAELTQSQIAAQLDTSQMAVSRKLTAILAGFREALLAEG